jgi:hypothetical protein
MWFPLSIYPEQVTDKKLMYNQESYNSLIDQLNKGFNVYSSLENGYPIIGKTLGTNSGGNIEIEIYDKDFAKEIKIFGDDKFFIATYIDGDAEEDDRGIMVVNSATLLRVAILPRFSLPTLKKKNYTIVKESTLKETLV